MSHSKLICANSFVYLFDYNCFFWCAFALCISIRSNSDFEFADGQNVLTRIMDYTTKFHMSKWWRKIFGATRIDAQVKKGQIWAQPCPNRPGRLPCSQPDKRGQAPWKPDAYWKQDMISTAIKAALRGLRGAEETGTLLWLAFDHGGYLLPSWRDHQQ